MLNLGNHEFFHFINQRIAVNAQKFACGGAISIGALNGALDERLLKDLHGLFKKEAIFDQVIHQKFEFFFHLLVSDVRIGLMNSLLQHLFPNAFDLPIRMYE